jgi:hypothetical protein
MCLGRVKGAFLELWLEALRSSRLGRRALLLSLLAIAGSCTGPGLEPPGGRNNDNGGQDGAVPEGGEGGEDGASGGEGGSGGLPASTGGTGGVGGSAGTGGSGGALTGGSGGSEPNTDADAAIDDEDAGSELSP